MITLEQLHMLRCMVESLEETTSNDYVYGSGSTDGCTTDMVSLKECREWLDDEESKAMARFADFARFAGVYQTPSDLS